MNVLFISPSSYRESIGGIERYLVNLISYSKQQSNHKVFLLLPTNQEDRKEMFGNTTIFHTKSLTLDSDNFSVQNKISKKASEFASILNSIIIEQEIQLICAEDIHIGLPAAFTIFLHLTAGTHNIPVILQLHSFTKTPLQEELINSLLWNKISCVSTSIAGDCFHKGADINLLSTIYLGVNKNEFNDDVDESNFLRSTLNFKEDDIVITTACRIILGTDNGGKSLLEEKGVINLIKAFSKVSVHKPNLKLVIAVGRTTDALASAFDATLEMLNGYIKLHNIKDKTVVKLFTLEQMPLVYKGSDIFVLASENETFGQVFIEAMASGIPVIGTKVGGIPEIISDGYNGFLVNPNDATTLANRIEMLIDDKTLLNSFIENGIKNIENNFDSDIQSDKFFAMLETILQEN
jgi:glycosyltransferase involved in cell wall biosynthesis